MQQQWQASVHRMSGQLSAQAHRTYIQPLVYLGFDPESGVLRLGAPSQVKLNIVREQFARTIDAAVEGCFERPVTVRFEVTAAPDESPSDDSEHAADGREPDAGGEIAEGAVDERVGDRRAAVTTGNESAGDDRRFNGRSKPPAARRAPVRRRDQTDDPVTPGFGALGARAPDDRTRLLPDVTFASFVTGKANELARAAALQGRRSAGHGLQPAVHPRRGRPGQDPPDACRRQRHPRARADSHDSLRHRPTSSSRTWCRRCGARRSTRSSATYQSLDLLLIDDIQFLSEQATVAGRVLLRVRIPGCRSPPDPDHRATPIRRRLANIDDRLKSRASTPG